MVKWFEVFSNGSFPSLPESSRDPFGLDQQRVLGKPLAIIAVQGICYTVGLELMLATDIRVASSNTRFGQIEVKRGIYPVGGATIRLQQEVGWGNAMRYLLTGDEISAEDAYRIGLIQEVTAPGEQFKRALTLAETICEQAPLGVQATLRSAHITRQEGTEKAISRLLPDLQPIMEKSSWQRSDQPTGEI